MKTNSTKTKDLRKIAIIKRAIEETDFELDLDNDLLINFAAARDALLHKFEYDRIEIADVDKSYSHISWSDGNGFEYHADGEFINVGADRHLNHFYVQNEQGRWYRTNYHEHNPGDVIYVYMADVIDSDAQVVYLVAKYII